MTKRWAVKAEGNDQILWVKGTNSGVAERRATKALNIPYKQVLGASGKPISTHLDGIHKGGVCFPQVFISEEQKYSACREVVHIHPSFPL